MVYIRTDSNPVISGGHIMRCLAVAQALIENGIEVCFLTADENPVTILEKECIPYIVLNSDWKDLMTDIDKVKELLIKDDNALLLIDTYHITKVYVEELSQYAKIAYLGSKSEYLGQLDLLINYSTDIDFVFYSSNYKNTSLLLGPSFAPLRREFRNIIPEYRKAVGRILLTTGNTDNNNFVSSIIKGLLPIISDKPIMLDVIVGPMFGYKDQLHLAYDDCPCVELHENVKSVSSIMKECDLAISANGTTVYELSALGLPTISFAMVEEQVKSAEALNKLGAVDYCGKAFENVYSCINTIIERVSFYIDHRDDMIALAKRAHNLIDGNGVQKIVAAISKLQQQID